MKKRYRNVKLKRIDGFTVARATQKETGLPYDVYVDSLGSKRSKDAGIPRVGVIIGDIVIPVSISEDPATLSGYDFPHSDMIFKWVRKYKDTLLKHWNKEICDHEVLTAICEVYDAL